MEKKLENLNLNSEGNTSSNGSLQTSGTSMGQTVYSEDQGPFTLEMARNLERSTE